MTTIRNYKLFKKGETIGIALSGGKDSLTTLHILNKLAKQQRTTKILAITIDEGIKGYRDKTLEFAKKYLNCNYFNFIDINGSKYREKDEILKRLWKKDCVENGVFFRGAFGGGYDKLIILIDECDQLKDAAFKYLRGEIEATQSYTRWCFTCNDDKSIPDAIKSRVHYMPFKKVSAKMFYTKMFDILEKEKIDYTPKILKAYSDHYYCDIRQCISQLQTNAIDGKLSQL